MKKFETLKAGLSNGLVVQYDAEPSEYGMTGLTERTFRTDDVHEDGAALWILIEDSYPHLFPLSHLAKPVRVEGYNDGKEFVPMEELLRIKIERMKLSEPIINITETYLVKSFWIETKISHKYGRDSVSVILIDGFERWEYWIIELLHKWHFNVFSLPESDYIDASISKVYEPK